MEPIKFTLCEEREHCPEVEITDQGVRIGEDENTVRLSQGGFRPPSPDFLYLVVLALRRSAVKVA
jgi:hypothetical protein